MQRRSDARPAACAPNASRTRRFLCRGGSVSVRKRARNNTPDSGSHVLGESVPACRRSRRQNGIGMPCRAYRGSFRKHGESRAAQNLSRTSTSPTSPQGLNQNPTAAECRSKSSDFPLHNCRCRACCLTVLLKLSHAQAPWERCCANVLAAAKSSPVRAATITNADDLTWLLDARENRIRPHKGSFSASAWEHWRR